MTEIKDFINRHELKQNGKHTGKYGFNKEDLKRLIKLVEEEQVLNLPCRVNVEWELGKMDYQPVWRQYSSVKKFMATHNVDLHLFNFYLEFGEARITDIKGAPCVSETL